MSANLLVFYFFSEEPLYNILGVLCIILFSLFTFELPIKFIIIIESELKWKWSQTEKLLYYFSLFSDKTLNIVTECTGYFLFAKSENRRDGKYGIILLTFTLLSPPLLIGCA